MSWHEAFSARYDEWAAHMTEDIAFYVGLAREADGPLVELAIGNGRLVPGRPGRERISTCVRATCGTSNSPSRRR